VWRHRSPSESGGGIQRRQTDGGSGRALLSREAGSEAMGHMAAPDPTRMERLGPVMRGYLVCRVPTPATKRSHRRRPSRWEVAPLHPRHPLFLSSLGRWHIANKSSFLYRCPRPQEAHRHRQPLVLLRPHHHTVEFRPSPVNLLNSISTAGDQPSTPTLVIFIRSSP
jgi:hypothetical protein